LRTLDNNRVFLRVAAYEGVRRVSGTHTVELRTKDAYWFPQSLAQAINAEMATVTENILTECMDPF
jgi:hypothetical protein